MIHSNIELYLLARIMPFNFKLIEMKGNLVSFFMNSTMMNFRFSSGSHPVLTSGQTYFCESIPGGAVTIHEQFEFDGYSSGKFGDIIS